MYETQARLTDAYLATSQPTEARAIAEDLVAREPWEPAHIERFRRALVMLRIPEPDTVIAQRLNGESPFTATDHFAVLLAPDAAASTGTIDAPAAVMTAPPETPTPAPREPGAAVKTATAPAAESADIDLTSMLGDLDEDDAPRESEPMRAPRENLEGVFTDLRNDARKGAADQSAQHMKLARTYLEMGMTAEAAAALKTAAGSPAQRFEAGSILGRMYKEQGDLPQAVEWLTRASEAPAPAVEDGRALLYDLAVTLEAAGDVTRALAVFLELEAQAGPYRDAAEHAGRLARVQAGG